MKTVSEQARRTTIEAALEAHKGVGPQQTMRWQGTPVLLREVNLPLDMVVLNPRSHRIRAQLESHPQADVVRKDPYGPKSQEVISQILRDTERFDELKDDLSVQGQLDPGVVTSSGVLVNANTRLVALRDLNPPTDERYIRALVLPENASNLEIDRVEFDLQMRVERKQAYTFTNDLLFIEDLVNEHNESTEDVARRMGWLLSDEPRAVKDGKARVEQATRMLGLIRDVIHLSGNKVKYVDFDHSRQDLIEIDRRYQDLLRTKKDEALATRIRNARLVALLAEMGYRELRSVDEKLLTEYLPEHFAESDLLKPHLDELVSYGAQQSVTAGDDLDLFDGDYAISDAAKQVPDLSPMLDLLAKSADDEEVLLGNNAVRRELVIDSIRTALEGAVAELDADKKKDNSLTAPAELVLEAEKKLKKAMEILLKVQTAPGFDDTKLKARVVNARVQLDGLAKQAGVPESS